MVIATRRFRRAITPLGLIAAAALLLSACATNNSTNDSGGSSAGVVGTRTIAGVGSILDTQAGFTLYHLTTEADGAIMCTGSCATKWPPLMAPSGTLPTVDGLNGTLGTVTRPDGGRQLTFDGMPLYRYAGDTAPGEANGQGIGGVWFAVKASGAGAASGGAKGSNPYGNGY